MARKNKRAGQGKMIRAASTTGRTLTLCAPVELQAAQKNEDGTEGLPTFSMNAYTGGPMNLAGWWLPVVIELSGLRAGGKARPILKDHDAAQVVGHTTEIRIGAGDVRVEGVISGAGAAAAEVTLSGKNGFPWQASVGATADKHKELKPGETAVVNGRTVTGPCFVVTRARLKEVSFVALGADDNTSVKVAAGAAGEEGGAGMDFETWLEAEYGLKASALSDAQLAKLRAKFEADAAKAVRAQVVDDGDEGDGDTSLKAIRAASASASAEIRAEQARVLDVSRLAKDCPEIAAKAVSEGWSAEKTELAVLKAQDAKRTGDSGISGAPALILGKGTEKAHVQAAALMLTGMQPDRVVKHLGEPTVEAGRRMHLSGLKDVIRACAAFDGLSCPSFNGDDSAWLRAAASSVSFTSLMTDSARKHMMDSYQSASGVARRLAKILTAQDFKTHTGHALTGEEILEKLTDGGEIKHGTLADKSFSYSVETYGRMYGLTRNDLINDDLGALTDVPKKIGVAAGRTEEKMFWDMVLASESEAAGKFVSFAGGNLLYGTELSIEGLTAILQAFADMVDDHGQSIIVPMRTLVVPSALYGTAKALHASTHIVTTGGSSKAKDPSTNIHAGAFDPLMVPHLRNYPTAWYGFADPSVTAAYGIAFLRGKSEPTVEQVETAPNVLGVQWRGYFDLGVCRIDKRGVVKATSAAAPSGE